MRLATQYHIKFIISSDRAKSYQKLPCIFQCHITFALENNTCILCNPILKCAYVEIRIQTYSPHPSSNDLELGDLAKTQRYDSESPALRVTHQK